MSFLILFNEVSLLFKFYAIFDSNASLSISLSIYYNYSLLNYYIVFLSNEINDSLSKLNNFKI